MKHVKAPLTGSYASRILLLLNRRGPRKTIYPSEVLPPHLKKSKTAMDKVRHAAKVLAQSGKIEILSKGKPVSSTEPGPIRLRLKAKRAFDYELNFKTLNFRDHPELYRVGKGEQGVLLVEPYKSEILPFWKFKTPAIAQLSARKIYSLFLHYGKTKDFVGMDMARKYLQMGVTRSRRYANHRSGKKYIGAVPLSKRGQSGAHGRSVSKLDRDPLKAKSAEIFGVYLAKAKANARYRAWLASL